MDETSFLNRKHASNSPVTFFTCKCFAVLFFLPSRCVNSLIWSKGSTEKQPAVRTSSTRSQPAWKISSKVDTREARVRSGSRVLARLGELARKLTRKWFAARFFDQRQTFIIATPQETLKSEIAQRVLLEMSVFSRHVQTTFFLQTLWFREWTRRWSEVKFLSTLGGSVDNENPQKTISSAQYFISHQETIKGTERASSIYTLFHR